MTWVSGLETGPALAQHSGSMHGQPRRWPCCRHRRRPCPPPQAVNVAAPFLLTSLLLGAVKERVVVVSSISAASSLDFSNLQQVGPKV